MSIRGEMMEEMRDKVSNLKEKINELLKLANDNIIEDGNNDSENAYSEGEQEAYQSCLTLIDKYFK